MQVHLICTNLLTVTTSLAKQKAMKAVLPFYRLQKSSQTSVELHLLTLSLNLALSYVSLCHYTRITHTVYKYTINTYAVYKDTDTLSSVKIFSKSSL